MVPAGSKLLTHIQAQSGYSLEGYAFYIASERKPKIPDMFILKALYERAITEADRRRFSGEANAEEALQAFWTAYVDLLVRNAPRGASLSVFPFYD